MRVTLYGIVNCNKVRAARAWLLQRGIETEFHDMRSAPLDEHVEPDALDALKSIYRPVLERLPLPA